MKTTVLIIAVPIIVATLYVAICGLFYVVQEICDDIKKAKRRIRQGIWDLEWEWKLWKKGAPEWLIK